MVLAEKPCCKLTLVINSKFVSASENVILSNRQKIDFDPFHATGFFLYPLKTLENQTFSEGIERNQWHEMG